MTFRFVPPAYARIEPPVPNLGTEPGEALTTVLANFWKGAVTIGAIMFVLYFVWGALRWMTAEGDKAKFEEGRQKITNALTGLVILAASVAIIELLGGLLNLPFLENLSFIFPEA